MSNIYGRQFGLTKEALVVDIFCRVTFGSTGAPTLVTNQSKGVKSIVRNSAGNYTLTFGNSSGVDTYQKLLGMSFIYDEFANAGTAPLAPLGYVLASTVKTAGQVNFVFNNTSQVATDPASTEAVLIRFALSDSTAY